MDFDAIGFDLDGTLWDACEAIYEVYREVLYATRYENLLPSLPQLRAGMGLAPAALSRLLFPALPEGEALALLASLAEKEAAHLSKHGAKPYPGMKKTLEALAGRYPLFLVSNCDKGYIEAFVSFYGLSGLVQAHLSAGDTHRSKGENIEWIKKRNGWSRVVYVGDTEGDRKAAAFAKAHFIHAAYGFGTMVVPAFAAETLASLPGKIETLRKRLDQEEQI